MAPEGIKEGRRAEPSGQAESLWGRIRAGEMGSRVARERPAVGALPATSRRKEQQRGLLEAVAELNGGIYRPRTKETMSAWEFVLAFVAARVGGEQRDVLAAAAEESLMILKNEESRDLEKKEKVEQILGPLDTDAFAQLVNLTKRITDFVPAASAQMETGVRGAEEGDNGVAVVFEEEEEEQEQVLPLNEEDEEEAEAALAATIPIIKLEVDAETFEEERDFVPLPLGGAREETMAESGEEPHIIDLESLAFAQGTGLVLSPALSTKIL